MTLAERIAKMHNLCQGCGEPRSFHKNDLCPHLDSAGGVESWGPETFQPPPMEGKENG